MLWLVRKDIRNLATTVFIITYYFLNTIYSKFKGFKIRNFWLLFTYRIVLLCLWNRKSTELCWNNCKVSSLQLQLLRTAELGWLVISCVFLHQLSLLFLRISTLVSKSWYHFSSNKTDARHSHCNSKGKIRHYKNPVKIW